MLTEFKSVLSTICTHSKTFIGKAISRKFIVFIIATHMVYTHFLPGPDWMMIAMIYIGIEGALDWRKSVATEAKEENKEPPTSGPP